MNHHLVHYADESPQILIVGASGRMVADLLSRIGLRSTVADLYADEDTRAICSGNVTRLNRLDDLRRMEALVAAHEAVVFSGGLEGQSDLASHLEAWTKPAFTAPRSILRSNDPSVLNQALGLANMTEYPFRVPFDQTGRSHVIKDLSRSASARFFESSNETPNVDMKSEVVQEFIQGQSVSITYCASDQSVETLGCSIQLIDQFCWTGSISGNVISQSHADRAGIFAKHLVSLSELQGVFGIDFIVNECGIWPVDVNPRIPASAEVLKADVLGAHLGSFDLFSDAIKPLPTCNANCMGKEVVFNRSTNPIRFSATKFSDWPRRHEVERDQVSIADVPVDGELIRCGSPICSIFAAGESPHEVQNRLLDIKQQVSRGISL